MEEAGRLQSMGLLRVRHDFTFTFTFHFHALENVLQWSGKVGSGQHTPSFFPPMGAGKEGLYSFSGNLQLGKED